MHSLRYAWSNASSLLFAWGTDSCFGSKPTSIVIEFSPAIIVVSTSGALEAFSFRIRPSMMTRCTRQHMMFWSVIAGTMRLTWYPVATLAIIVATFTVIVTLMHKAR